MEKIAETEELKAEKSFLKEKNMCFYDETFLYGFKNIEFDYDLEELHPYETIGLLDGATGVCLSLISAEHPENDIWKRAFLME